MYRLRDRRRGNRCFHQLNLENSLFCRNNGVIIDIYGDKCWDALIIKGDFRHATDRINARLSGSLAAFVEKMVGEAGLYETPSEYVRDLIRRDMERRDGRAERDSILAGYHDLAAGKVFASTGDFHKDMTILAQKEAADWQ